MATQKGAQEIAKRTVTRNESCARSLVHSAFDLNESLYDWANWLIDDSFVQGISNLGKTETTAREPMFIAKHPIVFADFNGDNQCAGIGLKSIKEIDKGDEIIRMQTQMGLLSDVPKETETSSLSESDQLLQQMAAHSRKIANLMAPGNLGAANKIYNHLILTQKLVSLKRGSENSFVGPMDNFVRTYMDTLPVEDLSTLVYWDQPTLNQVDSEIIRSTYRTTCEHYKSIYRAMVLHSESPFAQAEQTPISEEEFIWAFSTASARSLVLNNENVTELPDPMAVTMIVPLMDMINHSREPNCIIRPHHDKVNNQSFVSLQSIRPIAANEQLTISYGNDLANTHLIQKYGFVTEENPVKKLIATLPFYEYETIAYEETPLKQELAVKHGLAYSQSALHNAVFFNSKFPQEVLRQTRLSFLTSRCLIENGGKRFLDDKDFSEAIEFENERMTFDFIIESFERHLNNLKPRETYLDQVHSDTPVTNLSQYNQRNLAVLHLDEHDLLTKNLDFLYQARQKHLSQ